MSVCVSFPFNHLVRQLVNVENHGRTYRGKLILRPFGMCSESHIPVRNSHKYSFKIPKNLKSERIFFLVAQQIHCGLGRLTVEVSNSHR
jgi:hypothetical protein